MSEYTDFQTFTDYGVFDCDQHIYEPPNVYVDYLPKKYADRTIRAEVIDGRTVMMAQDKVLPNDNKLDECYRPGSLAEMLRSIKAGPDGANNYQWMPIDRAFLDPELRLAQMDQQRVDGAIMFCGSLGLFGEHFLTDDELYWESSWAYLRWMDETWGFARDNRIFMSPVISMRDVDKVCAQLDWIFERGVRPLARRSALRSDVGADRSGRCNRLLPHQRRDARIQGESLGAVGSAPESDVLRAV